MTNNHLLGEDLDKNFATFIGHAIETGCVWALQSDQGFALCPSLASETVDVMPLWSQPEYAQAHCVDEWAEYKVVPIALEELLDDWLPGMHADVMLAGVNWNADMQGIEIEPLDLVEEIDQAAQG